MKPLSQVAVRIFATTPGLPILPEIAKVKQSSLDVFSHGETIMI
jgi:hypothetical protein